MSLHILSNLIQMLLKETKDRPQKRRCSLVTLYSIIVTNSFLRDKSFLLNHEKQYFLIIPYKIVTNDSKAT